MTAKEILNYLDRCDFPMLDNGYYYHVDQKMSIYKGDEGWSILLQIIGCHNQSESIKDVSTIVYAYGNMIASNKTFDNDSFHFKAEKYIVNTFSGELYEMFLNPKANFIKAGGKLIPIEHNCLKYKEKGIYLEEKNKVQIWEFMRYICPEYSDLFWVDREELKSKIPIEFKEVVSLKQWQHPDNVETGPSDMNSFKLIAESIANNNFAKLKEIENDKPNTHWSNWPMGGTL